MVKRSFVLELMWKYAECIVFLPILAAMVLLGVGIFTFSSAGKSSIAEYKPTHSVQAKDCKHEETLYIEETRFSHPEIFHMETMNEQPQSGYLVTEEMMCLAQLVQAEAGNQDLKGKRLVADVVLNRVDDERFPNTVEEVIFQRNPVQFAVTVDGAFEKAKAEISEECFEAVRMEWEQSERLDKNVIYFNVVHENGKYPFRHGDHWFSY